MAISLFTTFCALYCNAVFSVYEVLCSHYSIRVYFIISVIRRLDRNSITLSEKPSVTLIIIEIRVSHLFFTNIISPLLITIPLCRFLDCMGGGLAVSRGVETHPKLEESSSERSSKLGYNHLQEDGHSPSLLIFEYKRHSAAKHVEPTSGCYTNWPAHLVYFVTLCDCGVF